MQQEAVIEYLRGNKLHLPRHGRCDSPRCTGVVLSMVHILLWTLPLTYLILDYSLVQFNETGSSIALEKEGIETLP